MLYTNIRTAILADTPIATIVSSRVFARKPITDQTASYITILLENDKPNDVSSVALCRILCFSKDMAEIETLANRLISVLSAKTNLGGSTNMYKTRIVNRRDSDARLDDGFYWTILFFEFYRTR